MKLQATNVLTLMITKKEYPEKSKITTEVGSWISSMKYFQSQLGLSHLTLKNWGVVFVSMHQIFFMLALLVEFNFLTTFYGLYFNHQLLICEKVLLFDVSSTIF